MPNGQAAAFSTHNRFVSLAAPGASAGDCRFGVFSTLPATTAVPWTTAGRLRRDARRHRRRALRLRRGHELRRPDRRRGSRRSPGRRSPGSPPSRWARCSRGRPPAAAGTSSPAPGVADGMRAVELARVYDVLAAARAGARAPARQSRARATSGGRADRTGARRRARRPRARTGCSSLATAATAFTVLASRRHRPFTKNVRIRGRRANVLVSTACDANGNCGVKRLGPLPPPRSRRR